MIRCSRNIIFNVENSCAASYFYTAVCVHFSLFVVTLYVFTVISDHINASLPKSNQIESKQNHLIQVYVWLKHWFVSIVSKHSSFISQARAGDSFPSTFTHSNMKDKLMLLQTPLKNITNIFKWVVMVYMQILPLWCDATFALRKYANVLFSFLNIPTHV